MYKKIKAVGIIAEYNPFHNGHLYHIRKIKERFPNHVLICILNGNFLQRGEPSIVNKYMRAKWALDHGIDLVLELPFIFGTQRADIFADSSIHILNRFNIDILSYGTENINSTAKEIKNLQPNEKLAYFYKDAISKNKYNIDIHQIYRITNYNDVNIKLKHQASATAIRKKIFDGQLESIKNYLPLDVYKDILMNIDNLVGIHKYYKYIQYTLKYLDTENIALNRDGLLNHLKKIILITNTYNDFFTKSHKKHISKTHLQRLLTYLMCRVTTPMLETDGSNIHTTILGINYKGMNYIKQQKIIGKYSSILLNNLNFYTLSQENSEYFYNILSNNSYFRERKIIVRK